MTRKQIEEAVMRLTQLAVDKEVARSLKNEEEAKNCVGDYVYFLVEQGADLIAALHAELLQWETNNFEYHQLRQRIAELEQFLDSPAPKELDMSIGRVLPEIIKHIGCGTCGGQMVFVRGRYPETDKREVCPTCLSDRMDQIREITSPDYGHVRQNPNTNP